MTKKVEAIVDALARIARVAMPPAEAAKFERELERVCRTQAIRDRKDLEREQLLVRHCPTVLPPVTLDHPSRPVRARRRRRHSWSKPKQLRLL